MSELRCKPGDLAVVIAALGSKTSNIGKIVRVVRRHSAQLDWEWVIEFDGREYVGADRWLRPIRDPGEDATDEMLRIVGKPQEVAA